MLLLNNYHKLTQKMSCRVPVVRSATKTGFRTEAKQEISEITSKAHEGWIRLKKFGRLVFSRVLGLHAAIHGSCRHVGNAGGRHLIQQRQRLPKLLEL
jgi:hypothetical protein